jgi:ribose-phosphate pyrophosphokinase
MSLCLVAGSGNPALGASVAQRLGTELADAVLERFPDGESRVAVSSAVTGSDVYVIQPTGPPVDQHLIELLMLVDAAHRRGADRITAVVPYFSYARQDRRGQIGEPVGARVVADLLGAVPVDRVLVVDPHTAALEAMFSVPVESITAVPVLAAALRAVVPANAVVVAPDLGAVKLAEQYAAVLDLPVVVVRKTRISGTSVRAEEVVGVVDGRAPVVVDDMISTAGTVAAAAQALLDHGCEPSLFVAATHGLLVGRAVERLCEVPLQRLILSDSLPVPVQLQVPFEIASIVDPLADAIRRLHENAPIDDLVPGAPPTRQRLS